MVPADADDHLEQQRRVCGHRQPGGRGVQREHRLLPGEGDHHRHPPGAKTAECVVFCRAGGGAGSSSSGTTGTVTGAGSGLFVRSGPGSGNEAIATILEGNTVTILEDMGNGWYRISFIGSGGRATEGYVSKDYIKVS